MARRRGEATLAHRDLLDLVVQLWPYEAVAPRAWELREPVTLNDAAYVAVAEATDTPGDAGQPPGAGARASVRHADPDGVTGPTT